MRPNPNLNYRAFKALTPLIPADVRIMVYPAWVGGRSLEAARIMAGWGMSSDSIGTTLRSLSVTLIED